MKPYGFVVASWIFKKKKSCGLMGSPYSIYTMILLRPCWIKFLWGCFVIRKTKTESYVLMSSFHSNFQLRERERERESLNPFWRLWILKDTVFLCFFKNTKSHPFKQSWMGEKLNKYKEKENAWISYEYLPRKPLSSWSCWWLESKEWECPLSSETYPFIDQSQNGYEKKETSTNSNLFFFFFCKG